jgi:hypothetical protein
MAASTWVMALRAMEVLVSHHLSRLASFSSVMAPRLQRAAWFARPARSCFPKPGPEPSSTGSATHECLIQVVWPLRTLRTVQLVLERWCGKALVTRVFQTIPGMLEAIYVSRHSYVVLVQAEKPCSFLFAAKSLYRLFSREHCSKILPGLLCLTVYNSGEIVAGWAAVLVAAQAASLAGGVLHWLTAMVAWLVALAVFKHVTSLSRHAVDALAVCYVQEVEACRPDAPVRVALALHDAVEHCWTLVAEDRAERDKSYSLESETVHTGDAL